MVILLIKDLFLKYFITDLYNIRTNYSKSDPMNYIAKILMNSQYGRYGMDDNFVNISIFDKKYYMEYEQKYMTDIIDIMEINDKFLVQHISPLKFDNTLLDNGKENHNTNIAIASAITAYARVYMTQFKNNPNFNLFYTDTDSIYIDKKLPEELVSNNELGKLKLELICKKAIFLAPKVYCLLTENNELIYKVKGLNNKVNLTFEDFESLLNKNSILEKNHEKWFKQMSSGTITIKDQLYSLKVTSNKRELIYNNENRLIKTKPYIINENKQII